MKIVFLNIYNGLIDRGAERSTRELGEELARRHEVHLIQGGKTKNSNLVTRQIKPLLSVFPDSSLSFWRKFYLDVWSLQILIFTLFSIPYLFSEHFDVVIPTNGGWQTLICRVLTWMLGSKLVVIGRAGVGHDDRWNLLMRPDIFIALTDYAKKWATRFYSESRIVHIPNGIDLEKFTPNGLKVKLNLSNPVVLTVASLMPNKNIELTITAVAKLPNASLLIVGDGLLREKLEKMGISLLGRNRFLMLKADYEEMPKYYRIAKIFTLLSNTGEAFGNVYLEAMATNLPIVATDDESRREIIDEAGEFINIGNPDGYVQALSLCLSKDFGDIPRKRVQKYSWDKVSNKYEELFSTLRK